MAALPSDAATAESDSAAAAARQPVTEADFECALCASIYVDPITLDECGHTFCRLCLHRSLEIKSQCPLCRASCTIDALAHPPTQVIANLVQRLFPQQYAERRRENAIETARRVRAPRFGIFVAQTHVFPGSPLQLHIFEPKYRVMVSRALSSSRQFLVVCASDFAPYGGVRDFEMPGADPDAPAHAAHRLQAQAQAAAAAQADAADPPAPVLPRPFDAPGLPAPAPPIPAGTLGLLVRILRCQAHADGRSFLECVCEKRVRVAEVRQEGEAAFGLCSAEVQEVQDQPEEAEHQAAAAADALAEAPAADASDETAAVAGMVDADDGLERKGDPSLDSVLRRRHGERAAASAAAGMPSSAAAASTAAASASAPPPLPSLVSTCRTLLASYSAYSGFSLQRLGVMHGGHCPPDDQPDALAWWILRVVPDCPALKSEALAATSVRARLAIAAELLREGIAIQQARTRNQVRLVAVICALAVGMVLLRHFRFTD